MGELSLDGSVRHIRGVLPMAAVARREGFQRVFVPAEDAAEAALFPDLEVIPVQCMSELYGHLIGAQLIPAQAHIEVDQVPVVVQTDFRDIKGQEHVKRALEVAASGGHNLLMIGPPGAGKTLMARSLPAILPRMTVDESLDVTRIYSVADALPDGIPLIKNRPFRAPHHTISHAGLVGAGTGPTRVRSRWHTAACSFWMNCPSSAAAPSRCCASRWKTRSSPSAAPRAHSPSRPIFS